MSGFSFRDVVLAENNLNSLGPESTDRPIMKFNHVGKAADGTPLALVVRAFSHYQPADANWNTLMDSRSLAQIAIASDSDAKFNFSIVDARTEEPFTLPSLTLSILDIDQGTHQSLHTRCAQRPVHSGLSAPPTPLLCVCAWVRQARTTRRERR